MASNKELLIIILDVRTSVKDSFKSKSIKCVAEILKDKICTVKKDYVSFVLLGTKSTCNSVYDTDASNGYKHITTYPNVQLVSWELLINFFKFVNFETCKSGQWLGALMVAIEMFNDNHALKTQRRRIVIFQDFNDAANLYDVYQNITKEILEQNIELIVVSENIKFLDNPESEVPMAIFDTDKTNDNQIENEKYALRLVSSCNAKLCNFEEILSTVFKVANCRPWCWNSTLSIGSKINIKISGILAVKDESYIKLRKCWTTKGEQMKRERKYYFKENEINVEPEELIDGYMLGATPIAFEETLSEENPKLEAGLTFLGFVERQAVPSVYFCGDALYTLVHQKGMHSSAKMLDALVKVLLELDRAILCWKVYSVKFNNPKLVLLLPNKLSVDKPASFSMVELSYLVQHHFWDFPTISTKHTESTTEQLEAIDELIDSMNLEMDEKVVQKPRNLIHKDYLSFYKLPHIYEQNIMDVLERKIIANAGQDDEQFQEMLKDKNFVDVFWKVSEAIEEKSKYAAQKIKSLFPLEKSNKAQEKAKNLEAHSHLLTQQRTPTDFYTNSVSACNDEDGTLDIIEVGPETPVEDFDKMLRLHVLQVQNITMRDAEYQMVATLMRNIIWQLLFKDNERDYDKLRKAFAIYRLSCYDFDALDDYNKWIRVIKTMIVEKGKEEFWQEIIVKHNLGLCILGEPSLEEKLQLDLFYELDNKKTENSSQNKLTLSEKELHDILSKF